MDIVLSTPKYSGFKEIALYKNYFLASAILTKKRIVSVDEKHFRCFRPRIMVCNIPVKNK